MSSSQQASAQALRDYASGDSLRPVSAPVRFLVVDDNQELAEDLCELLEIDGATAEVAPDAERALERVSEQAFVAVFTDLRLPGRNGVELLEELRRRGYQLPVVLVTAFADDQVLERARLAGALEVLSKPIDIERWLELARALPGLARARLRGLDDERLSSVVGAGSS